jgi:alkyl hydroperoxide reductase subunit AhpC
MTTWRNFDEILRLVDSLQYGASRKSLSEPKRFQD